MTLTKIINPRRPLTDGACASETSFGVNFAALVLAAAGTWGAFRAGVTDAVELFIVMTVVLLVATVLLEWLVFRRRSALGSLRVRRPLKWSRVFYREVALLVTFAVIGTMYWVFPAFSDEGMVKHYYKFIGFTGFVLVLLSVPYFCVMDRLDVEEEDALCRVGRALVTRHRTMTRFELGNYVRSWLVKAFWLSLMQPLMVEKIRVFVYYHYDKLAGNPLEIYLMASTVCYAIDLAYASSGYVLNFKLFNTHTRTAEPTLLGWVVALACYWPFWGILFCPYFFNYEGGTLHWYEKLFTQGSAAWWIYAGCIILLELFYALATVCAGIRFSNVTYRGLWNTGLYRWTKHPAYVFKNLSWWLISVPFLLNSGRAAVTCTIMLLATNVLYYLRARTEERHLSHYPEYVAYAQRMNTRSIFRGVARLLPFLRYVPPAEGERRFEIFDAPH